jgi:hypothetical protein
MEHSLNTMDLKVQNSSVSIAGLRPIFEPVGAVFNLKSLSHLLYQVRNFVAEITLASQENI